MKYISPSPAYLILGVRRVRARELRVLRVAEAAADAGAAARHPAVASDSGPGVLGTCTLQFTFMALTVIAFRDFNQLCFMVIAFEDFACRLHVVSIRRAHLSSYP